MTQEILKRFIADLYAFTIMSAYDADFTETHLKDLKKFFDTNPDLIRSTYNQVFGDGSIDVNTSTTMTIFEDNIVNRIRKMINELIDQINELLGSKSI